MLNFSSRTFKSPFGRVYLLKLADLSHQLQEDGWQAHIAKFHVGNVRPL